MDHFIIIIIIIVMGFHSHESDPSLVTDYDYYSSGIKSNKTKSMSYNLLKAKGNRVVGVKYFEFEIYCIEQKYWEASQQAYSATKLSNFAENFMRILIVIILLHVNFFWYMFFAAWLRLIFHSDWYFYVFFNF